MSRTYDAVLEGDHLEWKGTSPEAEKPVEVKVEVPGEDDELPAELVTSPGCDFSLLSPAERLELADRLWNSVSENDVDWTLTSDQMSELELRLAEYDRDPGAGETWESLRAEILAERAARRNAAE